MSSKKKKRKCNCPSGEICRCQLIIPRPIGITGAVGPIDDETIARQLIVGMEASPPPILTNNTYQLISTLEITIEEDESIVFLEASISAISSAFSVALLPLRANLLSYRITRNNGTFIRFVNDTDIDNVTTTFTAIDRPGLGTFTYLLEGALAASSAPGVSFEQIGPTVFTAQHFVNQEENG